MGNVVTVRNPSDSYIERAIGVAWRIVRCRPEALLASCIEWLVIPLAEPPDRDFGSQLSHAINMPNCGLLLVNSATRPSLDLRSSRSATGVDRNNVFTMGH